MPRPSITIDGIKQLIESEYGYKLLSTEYKNRVNLDILCNNNHKFSMRYDVFKDGQRCKECYHNRRRLNLDYVKQKIEEENYKLLSTKYNTNQDLLDVECDKKHLFKITYSCFQQGTRCSVCWDIKNKQYGLDKRLSFTFVKEFIEKEGYKLLSDYNTSRKKLKIQCNKEHIYEATWSTFNSGSRCPDCSNINNWKNCTQTKDYTLPSGKIVKYQGYENTALDILLMIYKEDEIEIHPNLIINYKFNDKDKKHYPDLFLPKENTIIEVKSEFTYFISEDKNIQKQLFAKALGYKYEFWIISDNRDIYEIIE